MLKIWIYPLIAALCASCSMAKSFKPYGEKYPRSNETVMIIPQTEQPGSSCVRIGEIHLYDGGLTVKCGYDDVLNQARKETSVHGGNAFRITRVSPPHFWDSTCYRIKGDALLCK